MKLKWIDQKLLYFVSCLQSEFLKTLICRDYGWFRHILLTILLEITASSAYKNTILSLAPTQPQQLAYLWVVLSINALGRQLRLQLSFLHKILKNEYGYIHIRSITLKHASSAVQRTDSISSNVTMKFYLRQKMTPTTTLTFTLALSLWLRCGSTSVRIFNSGDPLA